MALTDKMKAFARAKVQGKNNKDSALDAGYKESSASSQGAQLMKKTEVLEYIDKLKELKDKTKLNPEEMVHDFPNAEIKNIGTRPDPLEFLLEVMANMAEDTDTRVNAAKAALPYCHGKIADIGKKEAKEEKAKEESKKGGLSSRLALKRVK